MNTHAKKTAQAISNEYHITQSPYYTNGVDTPAGSSRAQDRIINKYHHGEETPFLQGSRKTSSKAKS